MKINNIDIDKIYQAEKEICTNVDLAFKIISVEGYWNFDDDNGQFISSLGSNNDSHDIVSDNPNFLGGSDKYPEPLKYFLFGIASCFASSYVISASINDVVLKSLSVKIVGKFNYSYFYSLSNKPKIEEIELFITVNSNATKTELVRIKNSAMECCPALSAIDKSVIVDVQVLFKDNHAKNKSNVKTKIN
ncbi:MAG TPA: hypothetical protein ENI57_06380 [Ignavibacteria bacterium]|nr:hypothetical protein [Ignavibacteria bacterium]